MMILEANGAAALDESAHEFIATFIAHVTAIIGDDEGRMATTARVNVLLLAALASGEGASAAWMMLHRTITEIVAKNTAARETRGPYLYLQSFMQENDDLVHH